MIDLTPVEVRKKADDFDRGFRGYEPDQVKNFLEMVADRLEDIQEHNRKLEQEVEQLREELERFEEREAALNDALLTAQELREESRAQAEREASLTLREAEAKAEAIEQEAERSLDAARDKLDELESRRAHFLRSFRALLEGYLSEVELEQSRLRENEDQIPPAEEIAADPDPEPPAVEPDAYGAPEGGEDGAEPVGEVREAVPTPSETSETGEEGDEAGGAAPENEEAGEDRKT